MLQCIAYPVILNDGTILRDAYEAREHLCSCGFSISDANTLAYTNESAVNDEALRIAKDMDLEYELVADGYEANLQSLCNEVLALAKRLESGKTGKGYTKVDVASALRYAVRCYE